MTGSFQLYHDDRGEFRFQLKADNGEIILASEGYKQRVSALDGIDSVRRNAVAVGRYECKQTRAGTYMFVLTGRSGQVIGASEGYQTAYGRDYGIDAVRKTAPDAPLIDATD